MSEGARRLAAAACVAVALWSRPADAVEVADVPIDKAALILTRALAYDRKLKDRAGDELDLAVLVRAGDPKSKDDGEEVYAAFKELEDNTVSGLPFRVVMLEYSDADKLERDMDKRDIDAVYVAPGLGGSVAEIREVVREQHATSLAASKSYVSAGLALGVFIDEGKPTIHLNLRAAKAEGADFAAGLLRLVKMV